MDSFTGSTKAGIKVSQRALASMKRISMELGGKSPFIILPGADYEKAQNHMCFNSLLLNSGQTCGLVAADHRKEAKRNRTSSSRSCRNSKVGDPTLETTKVGAVASARAVEDRRFVHCKRHRRRGRRSWPAAVRKRLKRVLHQSDGLHRCDQRHDHCPRRNLRAMVMSLVTVKTVG